MKKYNINFLVLIFVCFSFNLSAQVLQDSIINQDTTRQKTVYQPSLFSENLYIGVTGGTQILFSKDADNLAFTERFTPLFSLALGKWFSPFWGARLQSQAYSLNGFSTVDGIYLADPQNGTIYGNNDPVRDFVIIRPDGSYRYFLRYINVKLDFQLSLLNLIYGYRDTRRIDIVPALGLGYMHVFDYKGIPNTNTISANFGLMAKYHLNNHFDIDIEMQSSILPDHFDGRIAGNKYENYSSASIGITYYFKNRGFKPKVCPPNIPIVKVVKETDTLYQVVYKVDTVIKEIHKIDTVQINTVRKAKSEKERKTEKGSEKILENKVKGTKYVVQEGERLYSIARHYYKDPSLWTLIYKANLRNISNPEFLPAGLEIEMPILQGSVSNLSAEDKKYIAQGYLEVYLYYKETDKDRALHHLFIGKSFDTNVLNEYANRIDSGDIELSNKFKK